MLDPGLGSREQGFAEPTSKDRQGWDSVARMGFAARLEILKIWKFKPVILGVNLQDLL